MSRRMLISFSLLSLLLLSCAASVNYKQASDSRPAKPADFTVRVYEINDTVSAKYTLLGLISIDDSGFTTDCAYDVVLAKAIEQARSVGADAIKIIQHDTPDFFSSCHRIKAIAIGFD